MNKEITRIVSSTGIRYENQGREWHNTTHHAFVGFNGTLGWYVENKLSRANNKNTCYVISFLNRDIGIRRYGRGSDWSFL